MSQISLSRRNRRILRHVLLVFGAVAVLAVVSRPGIGFAGVSLHFPHGPTMACGSAAIRCHLNP
jgi:hypothetical protein